MDTVQSIQWLKENNLFELAEKTSFTLKKVFNSCLGITDQKVLILGDTGFTDRRIAPVLAGAYYLAAKSLNLNTKLILQSVKSRGADAESDVIEALKSLEEKNVAFVNMSDKLGNLLDLGKSFRSYCEKKKHRFVSALSLGDLNTDMIEDVIAPIDIDYKPMQAKHEAIKKILDEAKEIRVKTKAGTDLYYNVEGMKAIAADGNYASDGMGGNLPAGEVYIPCNGKNVHGSIVIDGSSRNHEHTRLIKKPIVLKIEEGSIVEINGGEEAEALKDTLKWASEHSTHPKTVYRIGELGIGLNPKAKIIGSTLVDEKTIGTAHIGIGSNYWFGGNIFAIVHLDQIFKDPEIEVDGKKLEI